MAKISTYPISGDPTLSDKLIGTDPNDLNLTKNYTISQILSLYSNPTYKVYTALLTQEGILAPEAIVLENTIGNISFSYGGVGVYNIIKDTPFDDNKTFVILTQNNTNYDGTTEFYVDGNIVITTLDWNDGNTNGILYKTPIEIRIYN